MASPATALDPLGTEGVAHAPPDHQRGRLFGVRHLRRRCPEGVLEIVGDAAEPVNEEDCTACATCMEECPMGAITEIEED